MVFVTLPQQCSNELGKHTYAWNVGAARRTHEPDVTTGRVVPFKNCFETTGLEVVSQRRVYDFNSAEQNGGSS